jgi:hypothetical protein
MSLETPEQQRIERPRFALTTLSREELIQRLERAERSEAVLQKVAISATREIERLSRICISHGITSVKGHRQRRQA